ncbi:MAG: hypothetical protein ACXWJU_09425 [Hyphomicrobium sp.]
MASLTSGSCPCPVVAEMLPGARLVGAGEISQESLTYVAIKREIDIMRDVFADTPIASSTSNPPACDVAAGKQR